MLDTGWQRAATATTGRATAGDTAEQTSACRHGGEELRRSASLLSLARGGGL